MKGMKRIQRAFQAGHWLCDRGASHHWTRLVGIDVPAAPGTRAQLNGIGFTLEHPLPVQYKGLHLDCGYRIDVLVENEIILELKSVEEIKGIHQAQLLTYLRLSGVKQGFLINFNVERLVDGLRIFVL